MKKEQKARPISVTHSIPCYVNGNIRYWRVDVEYAGKLAMNTDQIQEWRDIHKKSPELFETHPGLYKMMSPIYLSDIEIPNLKRVHVFNYDAKSDKTTLGYVWQDGLFGRGARRAWDFRLKVLAEIINNRKNTKVK